MDAETRRKFSELVELPDTALLCTALAEILTHGTMPYMSLVTRQALVAALHNRVQHLQIRASQIHAQWED